MKYHVTIVFRHDAKMTVTGDASLRQSLQEGFRMHKTHRDMVIYEGTTDTGEAVSFAYEDVMFLTFKPV